MKKYQIIKTVTDYGVEYGAEKIEQLIKEHKEAAIAKTIFFCSLSIIATTITMYFILK